METNNWSVVFEDFEQIYDVVRYEMRVPEPLPVEEDILIIA